MKFRSIKARFAYLAATWGILIFGGALSIFGLLHDWNLWAAAGISLAVFCALAAFAAYIVGAYGLWSYKKLADGARQAEQGLSTWDEALSLEDLPEEVAAGAKLDRELVHLTTREPARLLHALSGWALDQGLELNDLSVGHPTLEDVYMRLAEAPEDAP